MMIMPPRTTAGQLDAHRSQKILKPLRINAGRLSEEEEHRPLGW
jgi:hypothetical protein